MAKHEIMFVDDERNILKSLNRLMIDEPYEIHLANSGPEALELMQGKSISLIISDMRMPEMDGVEFLKEARKICPDAVRMILSGYSELEAVMKAVNEGNIWRYITKPWEDNELKMSIANGIDLYEKEIERKKLFDELQVKNAELEDLNANLAQKVAERTWELEARGRVLNMVIEDEDIEKIIDDVLTDAQRMAEGSDVYTYVPFMDKWFSRPAGDIPQEIASLAEKELSGEDGLVTGDTIVLPLHKGEIKLGVLVVKGITQECIDEIKPGLMNFGSLLTLALSQKKALADAPDLLDTIDSILENT